MSQQTIDPTTDTDLAALVYGAAPSCEIWLADGTTCTDPARWMLVQPCGCTWLCCDLCREAIIVAFVHNQSTDVIAYRCLRCTGVFGDSAVHWVPL